MVGWSWVRWCVANVWVTWAFRNQGVPYCTSMYILLKANRFFFCVARSCFNAFCRMTLWKLCQAVSLLVEALEANTSDQRFGWGVTGISVEHLKHGLAQSFYDKKICFMEFLHSTCSERHEDKQDSACEMCSVLILASDCSVQSVVPIGNSSPGSPSEDRVKVHGAIWCCSGGCRSRCLSCSRGDCQEEQEDQYLSQVKLQNFCKLLEDDHVYIQSVI